MSKSSANESRTIAVTGAAGQLGRLIVQRLIDDDAVQKVLAIDLVEPGIKNLKLEWLKADIRDTRLAEKLKGVDVLMHLAFVVTKYLPRAEFDDINIEGSKNVFRAAAEAGVSQILYSSSLAAYGVCHGHPNPLTENSPRILVPEFPYSAAKFRVEEFLDLFETENKGIRLVRFRPSILVGENLNNPLAQLFGRTLSRGYIVGASDMPMPIVWDEDVADAFLLAVRANSHGAYNLSAEPLHSPKEIAQSLGMKVLNPGKVLNAILDKVGRLKIRLGAENAIDPAWGKHGDIPLAQSCEKARAELGWKPKQASGIDVIQKYLSLCGSQENIGRNTKRRIFWPVIQFYSKISARRNSL